MAPPPSHVQPNPHDDPDYHYRRGNELAYSGRFEEAIVEYDRAIELDPNMSEYYYRKGEALRMIGRFEEAIVEYDRAIKLNPRNPHLHYAKGNTLRFLGRYGESLAELDEAIELDPGAPEYHCVKAYILARKGDLEGASREMGFSNKSGLNEIVCLLIEAEINAISKKEWKGLDILNAYLNKGSRRLCGYVEWEMAMNNAHLTDEEKLMFRKFLGSSCKR